MKNSSLYFYALNTISRIGCTTHSNFVFGIVKSLHHLEEMKSRNLATFVANYPTTTWSNHIVNADMIDTGLILHLINDNLIGGQLIINEDNLFEFVKNENESSN